VQLKHMRHMLQSLSHFLVPYIGALLWPTIQVCTLLQSPPAPPCAMVFGTSFCHSVNCLAFGAKLGCSVHNCQEGKLVMSAHTPNFLYILFVWSVMPSLVAWHALLLPPAPKFTVLIFSLGLVHIPHHLHAHIVVPLQSFLLITCTALQS